MRKYKVKINDPNRVIRIRNRNSRTPAEFYLNELELSYLKTVIRQNSIKDYTVEIIPDENDLIITKPLKIEEIKVSKPPKPKIDDPMVVKAKNTEILNNQDDIKIESININEEQVLKKLINGEF